MKWGGGCACWALESNMAGGFGVGGSPLHPTSAPFHCHLLAATVSGHSHWLLPRKLWARRREAAQFLGLATPAASPLHAMGFMQLCAASSAVCEVCSRGWRWPHCRALCWGMFGFPLSFEVWQRKHGSQNQAWYQFKICQREIIIVSSPIYFCCIFSLMW